MSDRSKVDSVASGRAYIVTSVNDGAPESLADFVSRPVVTVTLEFHDQVVEVRGSALVHDDLVLVHEKDSAGAGKDVRTWTIEMRDGRFVAVERSIY